uniref:BTB/POZ domain-containing protein 9 n=1 Tax=Glossina palpalis gambiensis TaxID=67801 RepID=A0A1B0AX67_9MUSC
MSSQSHRKMSGTRLPNKPRSDAVELTELFSAQMAQLCLNEDYSDVTFIVENQRLPAHRVMLAARSEYFRALLYGGLSESTQKDIHLKVPVEAFKALLRYIYSGHLFLSQMDEDNILDTLGLANQYGLTELELAISDYLVQYLALNNACAILDAARLYNLEKLTKVCLTFMDRNAADILQHETFKNLSKESLEEILRRDSFFAPEVQIFLAVWEWGKHNRNVDIQSVVSYVRLPLMNLEHLLQVVRPSGILDPNKLLDAIEEQSTSKYLKYRAALWPKENVATAKFASRTIYGEYPTQLLNGDITSYDMEKGYTRHGITDANDNGVLVELGTICLINHIKILLWDRDNRAYSYFIEVSANQIQWDRIIDYSQYHCRSWQFLYFQARPVRYIKLVGTHNTVNKVFHVVSLEAMHIMNIPRVVEGIVAPTSNVATIEMGAVVVDGVSRTRNALLNGNYVDYDWDSGYTCHQLGSGEILVRLAQPYYVGSMRLLLWDCDDRTYSFYIETSTNQKDWTMVIDKRDEQARSWQNFTFTARPVVFIRIVGTRNTANEIFHCVHLECPSEDPNSLLIENEKRLAEDKEQVKPYDTEPSTSREISNNKNSSRHSSEERKKSIVEEDLLVQFDNSMDEQ